MRAARGDLGSAYAAGMTIVVGYVPTPEGLAAIDHAIATAGQNKSRLVVVNSGARGRDSDPSFADTADWDAVDQHLTSLGVEHELRQPLMAQSPAEEILQVASEVAADLIVIGVRRRSPVGKLLLGSTAQTIILQADCPVVAVKRALADS